MSASASSARSLRSPGAALHVAILYVGHGALADLGLLEWQAGYIERFVDAIEQADWSAPEEAKADVVRSVRDYLPADELQFLMELSIEPMADRLGVPQTRSA